jgi:rare lipoprotein A
MVACAQHPKAQAQAERRAFVGLASYYGPGFHGNETANGETFDQRAMTAAHRTLPLGTVVRVTNLENGRTVVVRINDRGPYGRNFRRGTIIDLSKGAAQHLRFIKDGLVRVRVEVLRRPTGDSG